MLLESGTYGLPLSKYGRRKKTKTCEGGVRRINIADYFYVSKTTSQSYAKTEDEEEDLKQYYDRTQPSKHVRPNQGDDGPGDKACENS